MKKNSLITAVIIAVIAICIVISQNEDPAEQLVGHWVLETLNGESYDHSNARYSLNTIDEIVFYPDGTCLVNDQDDGYWSISDDWLAVKGPYGGLFWTIKAFHGTFTVNSKELKIDAIETGNSTSEKRIYVRKE